MYYVDLSQKAISNSCLINIMIIIKSAVKIQQGEEKKFVREIFPLSEDTSDSVLGLYTQEGLSIYWTK